MLKPNTNRQQMTKREMQDRFNFRCKHRHNGWVHPACYEKAKGIAERIGMLDLETSNLKADFGVILSWCLKPLGDKKIRWGLISKTDVRNGTYDKRIVEELIDTVWDFDRLITHYGTYFDIPFFRTRAIRWNVDKNFPKFGEMYHSDVWRMSRSKLCISSNRQDTIARAIKTPDIKTRIHPDIWLKVQMTQDAESLDYILTHNKKDVIQLEANFKNLEPYVRLGRSSI